MSTSLRVDELMEDVRARVRAQLRAELARLDPGSALVDEELFNEAEAVFRRALERRRLLMLPALLLNEEDWELSTSLRFSSHRRISGGLVLFAKRRILLPLTRWLYEYSRDNFERQVRINDTLMAAIETLVIEVVTMRREVARLTAAQAPSSERPPDAP